MKILILSDSHGLTDELVSIKERHQDCAIMIHCGDSELEPNHPAMKGFTAVRGNCDFYGGYSEEIMSLADGLKVLTVHGHLHSVKSSLMNLSYRAREKSANIVCFGHSHQLGAEIIDDILFINPGSISMPRGRVEKTYVILTIDQTELQLDVYDTDGEKLDELCRNFSLPNE